MIRLAFDVDDTICHTDNRSWESASPNQDVIDKINQLHDGGAYIILCTARGSLSCPTREDAEVKYRTQIETWMSVHKVRYHELSFNKVLADMYVDDKACHIDTFTNKHFEKLKGGMSGASVYLLGHYVVKEDPNSYKVAQWAKEFNKINPDLCSYPTIYSVSSKAIYIAYKHRSKTITVREAKDIIESMRYTQTPHTDNTQPQFDTYIERIKGHLTLYDVDNQITDRLIGLLERASLTCNSQTSFCHGDFSIDNLISCIGATYVIDPIVDDDLYSSWLLDVSKLYMSAQRFNNHELIAIIDEYPSYSYLIKLLSITHWVRFRKYVNANETGTLASIDRAVKGGIDELEAS